MNLLKKGFKNENDNGFQHKILPDTTGIYFTHIFLLSPMNYITTPGNTGNWKNKFPYNSMGWVFLFTGFFLLISNVFAPLQTNLCENKVVEFMLPEDTMIKKLNQNRPKHLPYSLETFRSGFGKYFEFCDQKTLQNNRLLFLYKKNRGTSLNSEQNHTSNQIYDSFLNNCRLVPVNS